MMTCVSCQKDFQYRRRDCVCNECRKKMGENLGAFNAEITRDVLLLVDIDVPLKEVKKWTTSQCGQAEKWASAKIYKASDNAYVRIPPTPEFLKEWVI